MTKVIFHRILLVFWTLLIGKFQKKTLHWLSRAQESPNALPRTRPNFSMEKTPNDQKIVRLPSGLSIVDAGDNFVFSRSHEANPHHHRSERSRAAQDAQARGGGGTPSDARDC